MRDRWPVRQTALLVVVTTSAGGCYASCAHPARSLSGSVQRAQTELVDQRVGAQPRFAFSEAVQTAEVGDVLARRPAAKVEAFGIAHAAQAPTVCARPLRDVVTADAGAAAVEVNRVDSMRSVVVLPAPLGPERPVTSPSRATEAHIVDGRTRRVVESAGRRRSAAHAIKLLVRAVTSIVALPPAAT